MPSVLNDFGIISGLKLLCEQTEKNSSIKTKLTYNYPSNTRLSQDLEITLYRLAQEGINNVVKHAKATELSLILNVDNEAIILLIIDNGVGFDMRKLKSRVIKNGIKNMKSRAELHDGELKIHTKIGEGTRIWLRIPMNNNKLI
jgi:signal transduction histidine kinase